MNITSALQVLLQWLYSAGSQAVPWHAKQWSTLAGFLSKGLRLAEDQVQTSAGELIGIQRKDNWITMTYRIPWHWDKMVWLQIPEEPVIAEDDMQVHQQNMSPMDFHMPI